MWWSTEDRWRLVMPVGLLLAAATVVLRLVPGLADAWHAPLHKVGLMLPGCGLTRASLALLRADAERAWRYNPAAFVVVPVAVAVVSRWIVGRITGRWLDTDIRPTPPLLTVAALAVVGLWLRQQANFQLLISG